MIGPAHPHAGACCRMCVYYVSCSPCAPQRLGSCITQADFFLAAAPVTVDDNVVIVPELVDY